MKSQLAVGFILIVCSLCDMVTAANGDRKADVVKRETDLGECTWRCGYWGHYLICAQDHYVKGTCSSGENADCSHTHCGPKTWHAILCCPASTLIPVTP